MTPIFDINTSPVPLLRAEAVYAVHAWDRDCGRLLSEQRQRLAHQLAHKILDEEKFFLLKSDGRTATLKAGAVVMTEEELRQLMQDQFSKGVEHMRRFAPVSYGG